MKLKKLVTILLVLTMLFGISSLSVSAGFINLSEENNKFVKDISPEIDGYAIDYRYFSPVKENDTTKYPLVIWLHGICNGWKDGMQINSSDVGIWVKDEYQSRFKDSGGAFIFVPRSPEEKNLCWANSLIRPLRGAIDNFIAKNKDNIDVSRIYIGGYSMGGRMTLKMAAAYPEMFAAAFPVCPKWVPGDEAAEHLSNMPIWLTSSKRDPIVNYYSEVMPTWETLIAHSNIPEFCRFSTLQKSVYPDGSRAPTAHNSWYSVNYDMFSDTNGDYPTMSTINGKGEVVTLTYPDGIISWLSDFTSDYDGSPATDKGNTAAHKVSVNVNFFKAIYNFFKNLFRFI